MPRDVNGNAIRPERGEIQVLDRPKHVTYEDLKPGLELYSRYGRKCIVTKISAPIGHEYSTGNLWFKHKSSEISTYESTANESEFKGWFLNKVDGLQDGITFYEDFVSILKNDLKTELAKEIDR